MAFDQPPQPGHGHEDAVGDPRDRLRGVCAEIGAEARNLRGYLIDIQAAATSKTDRQIRTRDAVRAADPFRIRNAQEIRAGLREIKASLATDDAIRSRYSQRTTEMANAWEAALAKWPKPDEIGDQPDVEAVLALARDSQNQLDEMLYRVAQIIVPTQIEHWAEAKRVGDVLDFHTRFASELPTPELRVRLLAWIAEAKGTVPGIVDLDAGVIYLASLSPERRRKTWTRFAIAIALTLGTAFIAPTIAQWLGDSTRVGALANVDAFGLYVAVLFGAVLHVGVDVLKDARDEKGPGIRAVEDFTLWAHVHEREVLLAIISLIVVLFLYLFFEPRPTPWVALVLGYSWDSAIDVLLGRFTTAINKDVARLRKEMAPAAGT